MKTLLDRSIRNLKRTGAIAATFLGVAVAFSLTSCDEAPDSGTGYSQNEDTADNLPTEIVHMDDAHKDGQLVQGRQGCIDKLKESGLSADEAATTCDQIAAEAKEQMLAQNHAQNNNSGPSTVIVENNNSSGINDALFWYWIGSNSRTPYIYTGNTATGLTIVQTPHYHSTVVTTRAITPPPAKLSSVQTTYLSAAPQQRVSVARTLAQRPGVRLSPVFVTPNGKITTSSTHYSTTVTSRNGMSGPGIGSGG